MRLAWSEELPGTARRIVAIAVSTSARLRPLTTTSAPFAASAWAMARPIPLVEPVTRARRPERSACMVCS